VVSFIVLRAAQIGRKIPPFTPTRRERKAPASAARGRGRRCCGGPHVSGRGERVLVFSEQAKGRRCSSADAGPAQGEQRAWPVKGNTRGG
jgi:hypothetical protein